MNAQTNNWLILCSVLLGAAGQILLKLGASSPAMVSQLGSGNAGGFVLRAATSPLVVLGLAVYGVSTILWLMVLARTPISYAYPFISIGFIVTALYGWQFLGENLSLARAGGIGLIILGVFLVSRT
jgi:multidrug transporter EmrE-like cation transporter